MPHDTYNIAVGATFMSTVLTTVGRVIVAYIIGLGFGGRVEILLAILLALVVWVSISKKLTHVSQRFNPHARFWNRFIEKAVSAVSYLLFALGNSYIFDIVMRAQQLTAFTAAALGVIFFVVFLAIIAFTIYFEEYNTSAGPGNATQKTT